MNAQKNLPTKNTLLKNAQANAKGTFLREYFFATQEKNWIKKNFPTLQKKIKNPNAQC